MRKLITLLVLGTSSLIYGQHSLPIQMDTTLLKGEVTAYGLIDYSGTSIENAMSSKLIYGGYINQETKQSSFDKHKGRNIYGLEFNSEIDYRNYTSLDGILKGKYGFFVRAGMGAYASASYSDDLFGLTFFGNEPYLGDTAVFSGTEANGIVFQKIGFGLISKKMKSNFGVNFYNISNYGDGFVRGGELAADSSGSNVDLLLDARFRYADGAQFNKGWGVGFDFDFRFQTQWIQNKTAFFQAQFKNLGLMHINSIQEYSVDTSYTFNGFQYNQLFGDNAISIEDRDELMDTLAVATEETSLTALLPGFVQIGKIVDNNSSDKWQSFFGVRLYTTLTYNPLIYGGMQYQIYPWMKLGLQGIYGGFSKFRLGFYSQYQYKNIYLSVGSENLLGAIMKSGNGESIHLRLAWKW